MSAGYGGTAPPDARVRIGIVHSRFNEEICELLLASARAEVGRLGAESQFVSVPGALEIPLALQWLAQSNRFDALVAIGAVIRGDTYHFDVVANESARGVMDVALEFGIPVANGILTTDDEAQARARKDKGAEAVRTAHEMAQTKRQLADRWR
jgi:6,7-dimethyl-8-ribityllumazine synthase